MEKLAYLLWGEPANGSDAYRKLLVEDLAPRLLDAGAHRLSINVDDADADVRSPVPTPAGEQHHVAEVSFWLPCHDRRTEPEDLLRATGLEVHGYLVSEAVYTDYGDNEWSRPRSWPAGKRSPGVLTVCLIHRPASMDTNRWVRHWHDVQSPVSAAIQPRARYVRNEVLRPLDSTSPSIDGIVEEAWPSGKHVEDPMLFFNAEGDAERMNSNLEKMIDSVTAFIDMDRMRNVTMSEYLFFEE